MEPLPHLSRSTLRERTLQALRAAITSGQYRPGTTWAKPSWRQASASAGGPCVRRCDISSKKDS